MQLFTVLSLPYAFLYAYGLCKSGVVSVVWSPILGGLSLYQLCLYRVRLRGFNLLYTIISGTTLLSKFYAICIYILGLPIILITILQYVYINSSLTLFECLEVSTIRLYEVNRGRCIVQILLKLYTNKYTEAMIVVDRLVKSGHTVEHAVKMLKGYSESQVKLLSASGEEA